MWAIFNQAADRTLLQALPEAPYVLKCQESQKVCSSGN